MTPTGFDELLEAIQGRREWDASINRKLDAVYRTRLRHLFAPRKSAKALGEFADHLNTAAFLLTRRDNELALKVSCYEAVIRDALEETASGWADFVRKKKHVESIIGLLQREAPKSVSKAMLKEELGLADANLSRKLGLMEAAGLVERFYEGRFLHVMLPVGEVASPDSGDAGEFHSISQILSCGIDNHSAFIQIAGRRHPVRVTQNPTQVSIDSIALLPAGFEGDAAAISYNFGLRPLGQKGDRISLFLEWKNGPDPIDFVYIGVCPEDSATHALLRSWVEAVNDWLSPSKSIGGSGATMQRILSEGTFWWTPGYSLNSASLDEMLQYHRPWMDFIAQDLLAQINNLNTSPRKVRERMEPWESGANWESQFDRILPTRFSRALLGGTSPLRPLHQMFEFPYQDSTRLQRFEIVQLGTLSRMKLLFQKNNLYSEALRQEHIDSHSLQSIPVMNWLTFLNEILLKAKVAVVGKDQALRYYSLKGTVSNNILTALVARHKLGDAEVIEFADPDTLLRTFAGDPQKSVALCDVVVANDLSARWRRNRDLLDREPLEELLVAYPEPVPYGIGVPLGDADWKYRVHSAMLRMVADEESRESWTETVDRIYEIGGSLLSEFDPSKPYDVLDEARIKQLDKRIAEIGE